MKKNSKCCVFTFIIATCCGFFPFIFQLNRTSPRKKLILTFQRNLPPIYFILPLPYSSDLFREIKKNFLRFPESERKNPLFHHFPD